MTQENETPEETEGETITFISYLQTLQMEQVDFIENISGMSMDEMETPGRPKALFIAAVALVAKRKTVPDFSWSQAQKLTMAEISEIISADASSKAEAKSPKVPQDRKKKATSSKTPKE